MKRLTLTRVLLILLLLLVAGSAVAWHFLSGVTRDRYLGQPQVVGLPPGYDPLAPTEPYQGPHPARQTRPADPFAYPIPIGAPGPVMPTYAETLDYPFVCRTERSDLGQPLVDNQDGAGMAVTENGKIIGYSKDCSVATRVLYYYRSTESGEFLPLTDSATDIEQVDVNGKTQPFIVRLEIGTINRHIYIIALLRGPNDKPAQPDTSLWNGKLLYQMRGGVGIGRRQGRIDPDYIPSRRANELLRGYAIAHSTANQTSTSYDMRLAEDTMARVKRQFVARYGEPRYTIGLGKSGGGIQQYLIAQNRPGLLDAGIAMYAYPDTVTQITRVMDCELLEYYFDAAAADTGKWRDREQRIPIQGFNARNDMSNQFEQLRALSAVSRFEWPRWSGGHTECSKSWRNLTPHVANPRYTYFESLYSREVAEQVPFTFWDNQKDIFGTDSDGYANRTYDNVGVQYGLAALLAGELTMAEFLHLNETIGGWLAPADMRRERFWNSGGAQSRLADVSIWSHHNMTSNAGPERPAPRNVANPEAIAAAYRSGSVFLGDIDMPILDFRHYLEPKLDMHHSLQSFAARLRIQQRKGNHDNQIIWFADLPHEPFAEALTVMETWLENLRAEPSLAVAAARPPDATDRCFAGDGSVIAAGDGVWDGAWNDQANGACMQAFPPFANPRIVAGDNLAGDIMKCHLRPIDQAISAGVYAPLDVTPYREELQRIFPDGVCDYSLGDAARPSDL